MLGGFAGQPFGDLSFCRFAGDLLSGLADHSFLLGTLRGLSLGAFRLLPGGGGKGLLRRLFAGGLFRGFSFCAIAGDALVGLSQGSGFGLPLCLFRGLVSNCIGRGPRLLLSGLTFRLVAGRLVRGVAHGLLAGRALGRRPRGAELIVHRRHSPRQCARHQAFDVGCVVGWSQVLRAVVLAADPRQRPTETLETAAGFAMLLSGGHGRHDDRTSGRPGDSAPDDRHGRHHDDVTTCFTATDVDAEPQELLARIELELDLRRVAARVDSQPHRARHRAVGLIAQAQAGHKRDPASQLLAGHAHRWC